VISHPSVVRLKYPYVKAPHHEHFIEVAPGVLWLRFPLPFALNHINLWLLADGDAWTIVDTGIHDMVSIKLWQQHFVSTLAGKPISRVIATHYHPDHSGNAGWLSRHWNAHLFASRSEWLTARMWEKETPSESDQVFAAYYFSAGLDEETVKAMSLRCGKYAELVSTIPRSFTRLVENDTVTIGGRQWRVIIGTGHSPELICLYSEADRILISSDQVLPGISPNISVTPWEPDGDPLAYFLNSCRMLTSLDAETLVLPTHGLPFYGLHDRLAEFMDLHERRLQITLAACKAPQTIAELLPIPPVLPHERLLPGCLMPNVTRKS
jgi:glyoxylase-like metal-dependent hydrolase (beta-lactamase superfamily II)